MNQTTGTENMNYDRDGLADHTCRRYILKLPVPIMPSKSFQQTLVGNKNTDHTSRSVFRNTCTNKEHELWQGWLGCPHMSPNIIKIACPCYAIKIIPTNSGWSQKRPNQ